MKVLVLQKLDSSFSCEIRTYYIAFCNHIELLGNSLRQIFHRRGAGKRRGNLSIDWQYKENVRARLRTMIKALLKRYKYPPDQEANAIDLVLQQTEMISEEWSKDGQ